MSTPRRLVDAQLQVAPLAHAMHVVVKQECDALRNRGKGLLKPRGIWRVDVLWDAIRKRLGAWSERDQGGSVPLRCPLADAGAIIRPLPTREQLSSR